MVKRPEKLTEVVSQAFCIRYAERCFLMHVENYLFECSAKQIISVIQAEYPILQQFFSIHPEVRLQRLYRPPVQPHT